MTPHSRRHVLRTTAALAVLAALPALAGAPAATAAPPTVTTISTLDAPSVGFGIALARPQVRLNALAQTFTAPPAPQLQAVSLRFSSLAAGATLRVAVVPWVGDRAAPGPVAISEPFTAPSASLGATVRFSLSRARLVPGRSYAAIVTPNLDANAGWVAGDSGVDLVAPAAYPAGGLHSDAGAADGWSARPWRAWEFDAAFAAELAQGPLRATGDGAFVPQAAGSTSPARRVTVTNTGPDPALVSRLAVWGADATSFVRTGDDCTGETLAAGASCTVGVRFAPDASGAAGQEAAIGAVGADDVAGEPVVLTGTAGPAVSGPEGPTGPQGPTGPAGPAGADGAAGPRGEPGPTGTAGATGPAGSDGARGPAGATGADGVHGDPGPRGTPGTPGPRGDAGPQGVPGPPGPIGLTGPRGADGLTAVYRCQPATRGGKAAEACFVSFSDGTAARAGSRVARRVHVVVTRDGRTVASGARTVRSGRRHRIGVRLRAGARLVPGGRYRVRVRVTARGAKPRTLSRSFVAAGGR